MKRRNFFKGLVAIPTAVVIAKNIPAKPEKVPLLTSSKEVLYCAVTSMPANWNRSKKG